MLIFLYGSDTYRRSHKVNEIVAQAKAKYPDLSCARFDLEESDKAFLDLQEFVHQVSMFSPKKMAVVHSFLQHDDKKSVAIFLKSLLEIKDTMVILVEDSAPRATSPFSFLLKAPVTSQAFEELSSAQAQAFAEKEAEARGLALTPGALAFLLTLFSKDTWGFIMALDMLVLAGTHFDEDAVRALYSRDLPQNFFATLMAFERGNTSQKLSALEALLFAGEEPAKIFNMLASRAKTSESLRRFADYDISVKSGQLEYEEVLLELVISD